MWWSLLLVPPVALFFYVLIYECEREDARTQADEFIAGIRPRTPKEIDKCISRLETANSRLLSTNVVDLGRVKRLRSLRCGHPAEDD